MRTSRSADQQMAYPVGEEEVILRNMMAGDDRLTHALVPDEITVPALAALLGETERIEHLAIPDLRARFLVVDWAA